MTTPRGSSWDIDESSYDKRNRTKTLKRLIRDMISYKKPFNRVITAIIINAAAGALYPIALAFAINGVVYRHIIDLYIFGSAFFLLYLIQFFASRSRTIYSTYLAQSVVRNMRDKSFENLQYVPVSFFSNVKAGYLISRITNDGEMLSEFLTFQLPQVLSGITTVIVSIGVMFYYDFNLALYALVIVPVVIAFSFGIRNRVRRNYLRTRKTIAAITGNVAENISAIRAIKSFTVEESTDENFDSLNKDNFNANMKAARLSSSYGAVLRIIEALGIALVIYVGAREVFSGIITLGILIAFIVYVQEFFDPVTQLSQLYNAYQSSIVGAGRIYGIIESPKEDIPEGSIPVDTFASSLNLDNISFSYGGEAALNDINLNIRKGERIGIVGHTGAGKTTLSNLMLKLYLPGTGELLLDAKNTEHILTGKYRDIIIPVLQEPFLFRGTLYENIRVARKDATDHDIEKLATEFGLDRIFSRLPNRLNTDAGELGRNLSEGQKQAIAILRALIRGPEILIMDEPTSNIDPFSEREIFASLEKFTEERTLILITHRFSMISLVDRIVVIDQGRIIENGDFQSLMKNKGMFFNMYNIVMGGGNA